MLKIKLSIKVRSAVLSEETEPSTHMPSNFRRVHRVKREITSQKHKTLGGRTARETHNELNFTLDPNRCGDFARAPLAEGSVFNRCRQKKTKTGVTGLRSTHTMAFSEQRSPRKSSFLLSA
jgi:hypothetical protein